MRWKIAQCFEVRWWKTYLGKKSPEAYLDWKRVYWIDFLRRIEVDLREGAHVLDAGCGPAGIYTILTEQHVSAIDPLLKSYDALVQFDRSAYPHVSFFEMGLEDLHFKDEFDQIFCLNVINHVEDINAAHDALIRALKPKGTLVMSIDSHNHAWAKWILRRIPLDILHPHQYDLQEYVDFLLKRGMKIERTIRLKKGTLFDYHAIVATKP